MAPSLDLQFRLLDWSPPPPKPVLVPDPPPVETPAPSEMVAQLRASLQATVAAKVVSATELLRALDRTKRDEILSTTIDAFDALLGGGLPRGKMVELTGRRTCGRFSMAMAALAAATSIGESAALIDLGDNFDPQLAEASGVDLRRLLWIRPKTMKQAVMSAEMIAATGFHLIVLDTGTASRGRRVPDASWVRLARSAEASGAALLVSTVWPLTGTTSEAVIVAERPRGKWSGSGKSPRVLAGTRADVRLEKHRHRKPGAVSQIAFESFDKVER